ncbi:SAM-dependent methyltransferase [Nocardiopsis quinghaiensis]|uniref:SAM-dependent methyltransferase n=1 Tax=Nocardiopsis quinghaiensis TaxID=464995 RepID=UPI00123C783D|nr:class I SAM-dependent methyltransferase [Nocardiopsis quinghaiensis]
MPQRTMTWQMDIASDESVWNQTHDIHPILNPLDDTSVRRVLERTRLGPAPRVLDVGCGLGGWVFKILESYPEATCVGVDMVESFIERARAEAADRGVGDRTDFRTGDALKDLPDERFDLVVCAGLSEAFGGLEPMLHHLRPYLKNDGRMIIGQGLWNHEPDEECLRILDVDRDTHMPFEQAVDMIACAGWAPVYGHKSTEQEWDDFIWACVEGLTRWALDDLRGAGEQQVPGVSTPGILLTMSSYRRAWLHGYRSALGYATFVLRPLPPQWIPLLFAGELAQQTWSAQGQASHEDS